MDDDFGDPEYTDFDAGDSDEDVTAPCPACGAEIYDDAERCPECGHYLSREDAPRSQLPFWILIGIGVCLVVAIVWGTFGM